MRRATGSPRTASASPPRRIAVIRPPSARSSRRDLGERNVIGRVPLVRYGSRGRAGRTGREWDQDGVPPRCQPWDTPEGSRQVTSEGAVDLRAVAAAVRSPSGDPAALLARWRSGRGTWFSGPRGGLLAEGATRRLDDPDDVGGVLADVAASGRAPAVVVGGLPFDA